jgi:hypothetical protein
MLAARARANLNSRDFVSIAGRDRATNEIYWLHLYSDLGEVEAPVLDIDSGVAEVRVFIGDGALIAVDTVTLVCEQQITERPYTITLNPLHPAVNNFLRGYDLHEQPVFVYQGDFKLTAWELEAPAECTFAGITDTAPIVEGSDGGSGDAQLVARSHVTELTRVNFLKRSHASEVLRDPDDTFFQDTAVVGDWLTYLGQVTPTAIKNVQGGSAGNG